MGSPDTLGNASAAPTVVVLGAGGVGCYFGGMLARGGVDVTLIGRPASVQAITERGLEIDSVNVRDRVSIKATADIAAARGASVVLLCVKTIDTETAARSLAPHVEAGTMVVSMQNGVDNVDRIRASTEIEAIPAAVYVAAEKTAPDTVRHTGRGDLIVGFTRSTRVARSRSVLDAIAALFARGHVPCVVSANIDGELWAKLIMNCAYNGISALTTARYGVIERDPLTREIMRRAVDEVVAVARADGVQLPEIDFAEAAYRLGRGIPDALASTAQDLARGKRTEIDSLNGYVAERGGALGIPVPINRALWSLVRLRERRQR